MSDTNNIKLKEQIQEAHRFNEMLQTNTLFHVSKASKKWGFDFLTEQSSQAASSGFQYLRISEPRADLLRHQGAIQKIKPEPKQRMSLEGVQKNFSFIPFEKQNSFGNEKISINGSSYSASTNGFTGMDLSRTSAFDTTLPNQCQRTSSNIFNCSFNPDRDSFLNIPGTQSIADSFIKSNSLNGSRKNASLISDNLLHINKEQTSEDFKLQIAKNEGTTNIIQTNFVSNNRVTDLKLPTVLLVTDNSSNSSRSSQKQQKTEEQTDSGQKIRMHTRNSIQQITQENEGANPFFALQQEQSPVFQLLEKSESIEKLENLDSSPESQRKHQFLEIKASKAIHKSAEIEDDDCSEQDIDEDLSALQQNRGRCLNQQNQLSKSGKNSVRFHEGPSPMDKLNSSQKASEFQTSPTK